MIKRLVWWRLRRYNRGVYFERRRQTCERLGFFCVTIARVPMWMALAIATLSREPGSRGCIVMYTSTTATRPQLNGRLYDDGIITDETVFSCKYIWFFFRKSVQKVQCNSLTSMHYVNNVSNTYTMVYDRTQIHTDFSCCLGTRAELVPFSKPKCWACSALKLCLNHKLEFTNILRFNRWRVYEINQIHILHLLPWGAWQNVIWKGLSSLP